MRNIQAIAIGTMLAAAVPTVAGAAEQKLLMQDLTGQGVEAPQAAALSTATCHQIAQRKGVEVLCGDDLRTLMNWNALASSLSACEDQACFESSAKAVEARLVVSGSVSRVGEHYVLSLSLFDVKLARSLGRSEVKATSLEALHKQLSEAVDVVLAGRRKA